jgi:hypothetical protein
VELDSRDWSAAFGLGTALHQLGNVESALRWWKTARQLDPPNLTVRKQIWMVEHPKRFYPTIDLDWQTQQLRLEGYARSTYARPAAVADCFAVGARGGLKQPGTLRDARRVPTSMVSSARGAHPHPVR